MISKLRFILILLLVVNTQSLFAQNDIKKNIKLEAEKMAEATMSGDYYLLMDYTHPNIIKFSGGKEKMVDFLGKQMESMAEDGFTIDAVEIGEPITLKMHKGAYQALVPKTTKLTINGQKIISKDYLFGFSNGEGKKWTFVEAEKMKSEIAKKIFPDFERKIEIPNKKEPVVLENGEEPSISADDEESLITIEEEPEDESMYLYQHESAFSIGYIIGFIIAVLFFIAVLVGAIFLIIYLIKRKKKVEVPKTKVQAPSAKKVETKICKECEGKNRSDSKYCAFCGYAL